MTKSQILRYVPSAKRAAVHDAWQDSDGIWIMLNEGWNADRSDFPCRTIHEDTVRNLRYQIAGIHRVTPFRPGQRVTIFDNGRIVTRITPRWAYGSTGTIVRTNDLSVTVRLDTYCPGELVRVNYEDIKTEK